MTSSSAFISVANKSHSTASALPSPPLSYNNYDKRMPTFTVDRAPSSPYWTGGDHRSGLLSDTRYTSNMNRRRDVADLPPFLLNHVSEFKTKYHLPPIQHVMKTTPISSPLFDSYYRTSSSSPMSSVASSPTQIDDEDDMDEELDQQKLEKITNIRRKGSIASLLNSDPELKQLDEEENKCNYQSHFIDNYSVVPSLKRGRPRHIETIQSLDTKKQRTTHENDGVQACQSSSILLNCTVLNVNSPTRAAKGLRHFSKQVCDKVAEKGVTTYNEVADELAFDIQSSVGNEKHSYDQKNIRRRVYDALNVLMAMNIISKDKKVIRWLGIPACYEQDVSANEDTVDEEESSRQILLAQIEQEELRQSELTSSLERLRECVNHKLSKVSIFKSTILPE